MVFNDPGFLAFLAAPAAWFALRWLAVRAEGRGAASLPAVTFPAAAEARAAGSSWRTRTLWIPAVLKAAGLILVVLALARPVMVRAEIPVPSEGIELVMVLDRSSSMGTFPARSAGKVPSADSSRSAESTINILKRVASDFVRARASDRIALVTFARTP